MPQTFGWQQAGDLTNPKLSTSPHALDFPGPRATDVVPPYHPAFEVVHRVLHRALIALVSDI